LLLACFEFSVWKPKMCKADHVAVLTVCNKMNTLNSIYIRALLADILMSFWKQSFTLHQASLAFPVLDWLYIVLFIAVWHW